MDEVIRFHHGFFRGDPRCVCFGNRGFSRPHFLHRSNAGDQGAIRAALPDTVAGLAAVLPSLRTGEAIVSGEALVLPVRAMLDKPDPMPLAEDPSLNSWRQARHRPNIREPLAAWRGTYGAEHD